MTITKSLLKSLTLGVEYIIFVYIKTNPLTKDYDDVFHFPAIRDENYLQVYSALNPYDSVAVSNSDCFGWQTRLVDSFVREIISQIIDEDFEIVSVVTSSEPENVWNILPLIDYPDFDKHYLKALRKYQLVKKF